MGYGYAARRVFKSPAKRPYTKLKPVARKKSFPMKKKPFKAPSSPWPRKGTRKRSYSVGFNRPTGPFAKKVKKIVMHTVASENSYLENYVDYVTTAAEVKDAEANQIMWCENQKAASGGLGQAQRWNLMMMDPVYLNLISQNIEAVQTTKATIKSYQTKARLVNAGTAQLTLWEYRCKARNDQSTNLTTMLTGGFSDASTGINAKPTSTTLGATPFQNPAWCSVFKITKVKRWNLKPAQAKWVSYRSKGDFQFTQERISPDGNTKTILKGQSISVFVVQGSFGYLSTNTDGKRYGIVAPNLGIEYYTKIHYSWVKDDSVAHGIHNYVTGLTSNDTVNSVSAAVPCPVVINHPDSVVENVASAGVRTYAQAPYRLPAVQFELS